MEGALDPLSREDIDQNVEHLTSLFRTVKDAEFAFGSSGPLGNVSEYLGILRCTCPFSLSSHVILPLSKSDGLTCNPAQLG